MIIHIIKLILLTFHFIRICIDNRHWQVEKYYLILMTLLVRRIRSVKPEVNLLGSTHLFRLSITLSFRPLLAWPRCMESPSITTQYPGLIQNTPNKTFLSCVSSFVPWPDIKYRKILQVPASFCLPVSVHSQETNVLCIFTSVYFPSRVERAAWICIRISVFFAHFTWKNMLLTRLRRATPFVVTGLVGSAALYGYKARFLEQGRKRELLYFGMFCMSRS